MKVCLYQLIGHPDIPEGGKCNQCIPDEKNKECKKYCEIEIIDFEVREVKKC